MRKISKIKRRHMRLVFNNIGLSKVWQLSRMVMLVALLALTPSASQAQSVPTPPVDTQKPDESQETFKVDVSVVNIFFNVKDKRGALLPTLKKEDFEVFEDGQKQNIKF